MTGPATLQKILGVSFHDLSLLEQALVHTSYLNENLGLTVDSNERLEFLGDAVLDFVIAEKLYHDFPQCSEGEMTKLRSGLVRRDSLARIAMDIGLGGYLYVGKGEAASGGRDKPTNLAAALEAVIAAVYLDQGWSFVRDVVLRLFHTELEGVAKRGATTDYKSRLQQFTQARWQVAPVYRVVEETGPDHDKQFTVEVVVNGMVLGRGSGKSKKMAEAEAARVAQQHASFTD